MTESRYDVTLIARFYFTDILCTYMQQPFPLTQEYRRPLTITILHL